jgi:hypothetical protein
MSRIIIYALGCYCHSSAVFASDRRCLQDCGIFMATLYYSGTCEVCIPPILDTGCGFVSRLSTKTFWGCCYTRFGQHSALTHSQRRILHHLLDFYMVQLIMGTTLSGTLSYAAIMLCLSNVKIVVQCSNVRAIKKNGKNCWRKKKKFLHFIFFSFAVTLRCGVAVPHYQMFECSGSLPTRICCMQAKSHWAFWPPKRHDLKEVQASFWQGSGGKRSQHKNRY